MTKQIAPMIAPIPTVTAARFVSRGASWSQTLADIGLGDFVFFKLVNDYIIGTLFSMAMLSVVTAMVLKFTAKVAGAYWVMKFISLNTEGLSSQALQQGGIGLIMTMLIVTVPTIAAALWQGNMGTFMAYSAFGTASSPGPQGQPAGSYMPQQVAKGGERSGHEDSERSSPTVKITGSQPTQVIQPTGSRGQAGRSDGLNA